MSYYETRPALVDVDADTELVARVYASDERGTLVALTASERAPSSTGPVQLSVSAADWRSFARAVAAEVREWEARD